MPSVTSLLSAPRPTLGDRLLASARAGTRDRVLVLGREGGVEILAAALHRGCRAAASFAEPPNRPEPAEIVLAPAVRSEAAGLAIANCARSALGIGGRLALRLIGTAAASAGSLADRLRDYGFERMRLRARAEGDLLLTCRREH